MRAKPGAARYDRKRPQGAGLVSGVRHALRRSEEVAAGLQARGTARLSAASRAPAVLLPPRTDCCTISVTVRSENRAGRRSWRQLRGNRADARVVGAIFREFRRLPRELQRALLAMLPTFIAANPPAFPPGLPVKRVQGTNGVWEITLAPGGRATFAYGNEVIPEEPHGELALE